VSAAFGFMSTLTARAGALGAAGAETPEPAVPGVADGDVDSVDGAAPAPVVAVTDDAAAAGEEATGTGWVFGWASAFEYATSGRARPSKPT